MLRPKFGYNNLVCMNPIVTVWFDVPESRSSGPRTGEPASVYSVTTDRSSYTRPEFPEGIIDGVEFNDGDAIEVREADLMLIKAFGEP
jgi:hypothetical protein